MKQRWTWGEISCRFLLGFVFFLVRKKGGGWILRRHWKYHVILTIVLVLFFVGLNVEC